MRSIVALVVAQVMTVGLAGCQAATAYTPQTPGRAALGIEHGVAGVYRNGVFMKLGAPTTEVFRCSAVATTAATAAAEHEARAQHATAISSVTLGISWLFPPLIVVGLGFSARAETERDGAFAFAVDAVNAHNDAAGCATAGQP